MKDKLLKLLPQLTCYKCKRIPRADDSYHTTYKCLNPNDPHLLCEKCKEKCSCNFNVNKKACPLVSSLVEMLPFCCKNREDGCKEILIKEEMKSHHEECIFEEVTCINRGCKKKMPFKVILDHLGSDDYCSKQLCNLGKGKTLKMKLTYTDDGSYWHPFKVESNPLNEPLFYVIGFKQNKTAYIWTYYIGFKKEANRFSYSLEIGDKTCHYINFVGQVKSIFESYDDIVNTGDVFTICIPALQKLCDKDKEFECVLNIIDKKAETQDSDDDSGVSDET